MIRKILIIILKNLSKYVNNFIKYLRSNSRFLFLRKYMEYFIHIINFLKMFQMFNIFRVLIKTFAFLNLVIAIFVLISFTDIDVDFNTNAAYKYYTISYYFITGFISTFLFDDFLINTWQMIKHFLHKIGDHLTQILKKFNIHPEDQIEIDVYSPEGTTLSLQVEDTTNNNKEKYYMSFGLLLFLFCLSYYYFDWDFDFIYSRVTNTVVTSGIHSAYLSLLDHFHNLINWFSPSTGGGPNLPPVTPDVEVVIPNDELFDNPFDDTASSPPSANNDPNSPIDTDSSSSGSSTPTSPNSPIGSDSSSSGSSTPTESSPPKSSTLDKYFSSDNKSK